MTRTTYHSEEAIAERLARAVKSADAYPHLTGILDAVCQEQHLRWEDVCGFRRDPKFVSARRAFVALAREVPTQYIGGRRPSFPEIAMAMGAPSHSTVITGYRHVYSDPLAKSIVQAVCSRLGVPDAERPAWLTLAPLAMRTPVGGDDAT